MKIVILDGGTTNPGDISWEPIEKLGEVTAYDSTPEELVIERAKDAEAIIMNRIVMSRSVMEQLPKLKYIGALATGFNTIDTVAAKEMGITVCNVPFYCVETVAQLAFALLLALCNRVETHSEVTRGGGWNESIRMSHTSRPIFELYGKTLGIVGYGNIGKTVANLGRALGMKILVYSKNKKQLPDGDRQVSLQELFRDSDVISLHCALNDETRGLVDKKLLSSMKKTALIINTARGAVINEADLAEALNKGTIAGAGLDVMTKEPPEEDNPLLTAKNCIMTPHIAWASKDARARLVDIVADNLYQYTQGRIQNCVNP